MEFTILGHAPARYILFHPKKKRNPDSLPHRKWNYDRFPQSAVAFALKYGINQRAINNDLLVDQPCLVSYRTIHPNS